MKLCDCLLLTICNFTPCIFVISITREGCRLAAKSMLINNILKPEKFKISQFFCLFYIISTLATYSNKKTPYVEAPYKAGERFQICPAFDTPWINRKNSQFHVPCLNTYTPRNLRLSNFSSFAPFLESNLNTLSSSLQYIEHKKSVKK